MNRDSEPGMTTTKLFPRSFGFSEKWNRHRACEKSALPPPMTAAPVMPHRSVNPHRNGVAERWHPCIGCRCLVARRHRNRLEPARRNQHIWHERAGRPRL